MKKLENKNICKSCKHFREVISSDVVFIERIELCDKLDIEWPCEECCEDFESDEDD